MAALIRAGIVVVTPEGEEVEFIEVCDPLVSNIAFGGDDMKTAYITAGSTGKLLVTEWARPGLKLAYQDKA